MRKVLLALAVILMGSSVEATHLFRNNASNINAGTLDPDRLPNPLPNDKIDSSSVTKYGPSIPADKINGAWDDCTVVIGTSGATNVDYTVSSLSDWNNLLSGLGMRGLTTSATAQASVCAKDGVYPINGSAIVPAGMKLIGISSAVFTDVGTANTELINVFGTVTGMKFDIGGLAFIGAKIRISSGAYFDNNEVYGAWNQAGGFNGNALVYVDRAINARISRLRLKDPKAVGGGTRYGEAGGLVVNQSSGVWIQIDEFIGGGQTAASSSNIGIIKSSNVHIVNSQLRPTGGNVIVIQDGSVNTTIENTRIDVIGGPGDQGVIVVGIDDGNTSSVSSVTVINNVHMTAGLNGSSRFIAVRGTSAGKRTFGLLINNTTAKGAPGSTDTFIGLGTGSFNTIILNSASYGMPTCLSDSGTGTVKGQLYKDGVLQ